MQNEDKQVLNYSRYNRSMKSSLQLSSSTKLDKEDSKKLKIIINCLTEANESFDFREPVDWKAMGLTDYLTVVKYPMDLSTVNRLFKEERYDIVEEVFDDIQLIWDNCKAYNPEASWIHSVAEKLERSFKKMVKNYFPDFSVAIPVKMIDEKEGPSTLFEQESEDITYEQKLKFSEELSYLPSKQLGKLIDEIIERCPGAYRDQGEGRGQILVDSMDLIFFNQISLMMRQLLSNGAEMAVEQEKPKRGRGRPPINPKP